jgi:hypothetical protein
MTFFLLIASYVAYKVSYVGAENWGGVGPIVAAILGIVGSFAVTFGIVIAMDSLAPQQSALELLMPALRASSLSLFISPVSAFYGWRNSRLSNKPSSVVETTYSDERDGLEPEWVNSRDDHIPESENNDETQGIDAELAGAIYSEEKDAPPPKWNLRKYLPSELTPYTKKVIVASAVWIMGAICWFMIEEGLDDGENVLVYILPPLVLIVAAILWKWANKSPTDVPRQSGVDRTK